MSKKWDYGGAYETNPIQEGEVARWDDGSNVRVNNIFDKIPAEWREADCIFVDPPWNLGNLNSFYTKADRKDYQESFDPFYKRLFEVIKTIRPAVCYVEIGKEYLADFILEMRKLYKYVTFYNSSYYHRKENKCYIIRGSRKAKKPDLDYIDEEDVINWIGEHEQFSCICDPCIGRGLVAMAASKNGRKFCGGELNPKRLSVLLQRVPGYQIEKGETP